MPGGFDFSLGLCAEQNSGIVYASSASANTKGAWTGLISSLSNDCSFLRIQLQQEYVGTGSAATDIGIGGAGSEVVLIPNLVTGGIWYPGAGFVFNLPFELPAGTRIAARVQASVGSVSDITSLSLSAYAGNFNTGGRRVSGVDAYGFNSGTTLGTAITIGAGGAFGSYIELTSSTTRDYKGFFALFDTRNHAETTQPYIIIELATGGAGSEVNFVTQFLASMMGSGTTGSNIQFGFANMIPYTEIAIPAGTRISARCKDTNPSALTPGLTFYGVY